VHVRSGDWNTSGEDGHYHYTECKVKHGVIWTLQKVMGNFMFMVQVREICCVPELHVLYQILQFLPVLVWSVELVSLYL